MKKTEGRKRESKKNNSRTERHKSPDRSVCKYPSKEYVYSKRTSENPTVFSRYNQDDTMEHRYEQLVTVAGWSPQETLHYPKRECFVLRVSPHSQ